MNTSPKSTSLSEDTIAAISTPLGEGGLGIVRISGKEALLAFIAGYEVENRIGRVLFEHHDERGWHMSGMVGVSAQPQPQEKY